ncbi:MAG: DUF3352 domain-containing protein [Planctomycetes bacterium]|nr:DUF3352 domain-containing protein [Planctomycetota bacterium]
MRKRFVSLALVVALAGVLAQAAPPLADRMPADAVLYVGWAGRNLAFDGAKCGQMLNHPAAKQIAATIRNAILAKLPESQQLQAADRAWEMLSIAWQHKIALCVTDSQAASPAQGQSPWPGLIPNVGLLVDLGPDREVFAEHFEALLALFGGAVPLAETTVGEITYRAFQANPQTPVISVGYIGETFFLTVGQTMPAKLIALAEAADKSLLNAAKFTEAYKEVSGENEQFAMYIDSPALDKIVANIIPAIGGPPGRMQAINAALGFSKVRARVTAVRVVDRGLYTKTRILSPAPHEGLLALLAGPPITADDLGIAPADADFVLAWKGDASSLPGVIKQLAGVIDERAGMMLADAGEQIRQQLGFSLKEDLLAHMGDQWTLVSAPSLGGFLTGTVLVVQLKDEAKFVATMEKIETLLNNMGTTQPADSQPAEPRESNRRHAAPSLLSVTAGETKISYLKLPLPVSPAWAVHEGSLIVAAWPQVVKSVIENADTPRLIADSGFKQALNRVSPQACMLCYVNLPKIARQLYPLPLLGWTGMANLLSNEGLAECRPDWLPSISAIDEFLWPSIAAVSADEGGITVEDYCSLPMAGVSIVATSAAATSILLPSLGQARALAKQSMSLSNIRQIGTGILMFEADHDEPPADLETLVKADFISKQVLISPISNKKAYVYIGLPSGAPMELILAYEDPGTHGHDKTAVLLADGRVKMMPVDERFWELVRRSEQAACKPSPRQDGS